MNERVPDRMKEGYAKMLQGQAKVQQAAYEQLQRLSEAMNFDITDAMQCQSQKPNRSYSEDWPIRARIEQPKPSESTAHTEETEKPDLRKKLFPYEFKKVSP